VQGAWKVTATFSKAAQHGLSAGREVLGGTLMGERKVGMRSSMGRSVGCHWWEALGWRPAVSSLGAGGEGGEGVTVHSRVVPCSEGFARHSVSLTPRL